jgi:hypothetical protein
MTPEDLQEEIRQCLVNVEEVDKDYIPKRILKVVLSAISRGWIVEIESRDNPRQGNIILTSEYQALLDGKEKHG